MSPKHRKMEPKKHRSQLEGALTGLTRDNLNIKLSNDGSRVRKEPVQTDKRRNGGKAGYAPVIHRASKHLPSPFLAMATEERGLHGGEGWQTPRSSRASGEHAGGGTKGKLAGVGMGWIPHSRVRQTQGEGHRNHCMVESSKMARS